jgi:hypothetical protein
MTASYLNVKLKVGDLVKVRYPTSFDSFEVGLIAKAPDCEEDGSWEILLASGKLIPVHFRRLILPSLFWHNIKGILK